MKILKTSKYIGKYGSILWRELGNENDKIDYILTVSHMIDLLDLYDICEDTRMWKTGAVVKLCVEKNISSRDFYDYFIQQVIMAKTKDLLYDKYKNDIKYIILSDETTVLDVLQYYSHDDYFRSLDYQNNMTFIDAVIRMENIIHSLDNCTITDL